MTDSWHAQTYKQFLDLRTRPARDLLSAIPDSFHPKTVYDLGCGPGNSTILLKERWPDAQVVGLDSSMDMLEEAKACYPNIDFVKGDIAHFSVKEKIDCLFANASLQWLDQHETLIPKLFKLINPGGVFAIQMPNNFHSPSHQVTIRILESHPAWQLFLKNLRYGILTEPLYKLPWYYDLLTQSGAKTLQLWETTYYQEMSDYQGIFEWVKGTGLRPVLSAMDMENQHKFSDAYVKAIAKEYPLQTNNKILLPFRRIFIVGCQ
ncbi:MAG: methyltransferase domain-containing protein [Gammaproteobacteria bacterium]|nr:methyltransferase domain-containing protein [Gammaproteobacteria bacterium]